jgi:hypothetical protein
MQDSTIPLYAASAGVFRSAMQRISARRFSRHCFNGQGLEGDATCPVRVKLTDSRICKHIQHHSRVPACGAYRFSGCHLAPRNNQHLADEMQLNRGNLRRPLFTCAALIIVACCLSTAVATAVDDSLTTLFRRQMVVFRLLGADRPDRRS